MLYGYWQWCVVEETSSLDGESTTLSYNILLWSTFRMFVAVLLTSDCFSMKTFPVLVLVIVSSVICLKNIIICINIKVKSERRAIDSLLFTDSFKLEG